MTTAHSLHIALVAGEASGDFLGAHLLESLKPHYSNLQISGIGGPRMQLQGLQSGWPYEKLAVHGYVEALRHIVEILGIRRDLKKQLLSCPPDLFVGVDAPDFNLPLAHALKQKGIKTMHMVSPSVWAWRAGRIPRIAESLDHLLCLFPFEPKLYESYGLPATFIGHPMAQLIGFEDHTQKARQSLGLEAEVPVIAALPGSRAAEVRDLMPRFAKAMALMHAENRNIRFVIPSFAHFEPQIRAELEKQQVASVTQLICSATLALQAADVALIASGTATLEAAMHHKPMVIAYAMNPLSWWHMRGKRLQPWVGLPNILCEQMVVPEYLQNEATPKALAQATLAWLADSTRVQAVKIRFGQLHQQLRVDSAKAICHAVQSTLFA